MLPPQEFRTHEIIFLINEGLVVILAILTWGMMDPSLATGMDLTTLKLVAIMLGLLGLPGYTFHQSA